MVLIGGDVVVELEDLEAKLDGDLARLEVLHRVILSGVDAILHDGFEAGGVLELLGEGGALLLCLVEMEVGVDGVFGDLLADVFEGEVAGGEARFGGADIVLLGVAEDEGTGGEAEDGRGA